MIPLKNSYTEEHKNVIIESRLNYAFEKNLNVENKSPALIGKIDVKNSDAVIKYAENRIVNAKIENAVIITKNGEVYHCTGELNGLDPITKLGSKLNGATITHNHPKNSVSDGTFSDDDLKLFKNYKLNKLRGIDERYCYELNRNAKDIELYNASFDKIAEMNVKQNKSYHAAITLKALIEGFGYRRWKI